MDAEYKRVYSCEGRWEGEDHLEGLGERRPGMARRLWSWGIGDWYVEQMRRAEPRKQKEKESDLGKKQHIQKLKEEGRRGMMWVRDDEGEYLHQGEQRGADSRDRSQS